MTTYTHQAIRSIQSAVNADAALVERGKTVNCTFMLSADKQQWLFRITDGCVSSLQESPLIMPSYAFGLSAAASEWDLFWQPVPPPGSHDLFALLKRRKLRLDGDLHTLMSNLFYFKFLLAKPRAALHATGTPS